MGEYADYSIEDSMLAWLDEGCPGLCIKPAPLKYVGDSCICGGTLVSKTNRKTGAEFLGCNKFPKCRRSHNKGEEHV